MSSKKLITIAYGDGIGPEIMKATLKILEAAKAPLEYETIEIGEKVYLSGVKTGIENKSWDSLRKTKVFLKAPITTPQGGGYKSLNVTIRKAMGLYANVRPCVALHPFVKTHYPSTDMVIVRENEEDLYAGIEHRQTLDVYQCLKLITHTGSEKIIRYAFQYAEKNNRKKVTCLVKDNIMKITDGVFHRVFDEVGAEYPDIKKEVKIVDIGAANIATRPETFDVVVTLNLYGDIISDIAAEVVGSVGMSGSSNVGDQIAMFEAIHGSAPDITGKNIANPSGLLNGAIMMLVHLCEGQTAEVIHNAWLKTLEDGMHTADIYVEGKSKKKCGTQEFADAVIERLGQMPTFFKPVKYVNPYTDGTCPMAIHVDPPKEEKRECVGVDVFLYDRKIKPQALGEKLAQVKNQKLKIKNIMNRGVKVWPDGFAETLCIDHWRCRFMGTAIENADITSLLSEISGLGFEFVKTEGLYNFEGKPGFSQDSGE